MSSFLCSFLNEFNKLSSSDHIDSCRDCIIGRNHRLLLKFCDSAVLIHAENAKTFNLRRIITGSTYHCNIRTFCDMIFQNFVIVHLVDTVAGCDHNIRLMAVLQELKVLVDGICGSLIPETVLLGDGRCKYKQAALFSSEIPPFG